MQLTDLLPAPSEIHTAQYMVTTKVMECGTTLSGLDNPMMTQEVIEKAMGRAKRVGGDEFRSARIYPSCRPAFPVDVMIEVDMGGRHPFVIGMLRREGNVQFEYHS